MLNLVQHLPIRPRRGDPETSSRQRRAGRMTLACHFTTYKYLITLISQYLNINFTFFIYI